MAKAPRRAASRAAVDDIDEQPQHYGKGKEDAKEETKPADVPKLQLLKICKPLSITLGKELDKVVVHRAFVDSMISRLYTLKFSTQAVDMDGAVPFVEIEATVSRSAISEPDPLLDPKGNVVYSVRIYLRVPQFVLLIALRDVLALRGIGATPSEYCHVKAPLEVFDLTHSKFIAPLRLIRPEDMMIPLQWKVCGVPKDETIADVMKLCREVGSTPAKLSRIRSRVRAPVAAAADAASAPSSASPAAPAAGPPSKTRRIPRIPQIVGESTSAAPAPPPAVTRKRDREDGEISDNDAGTLVPIRKLRRISPALGREGDGKEESPLRGAAPVSAPVASLPLSLDSSGPVDEYVEASGSVNVQRMPYPEEAPPPPAAPASSWAFVGRAVSSRVPVGPGTATAATTTASRLSSLPAATAAPTVTAAISGAPASTHASSHSSPGIAAFEVITNAVQAYALTMREAEIAKACEKVKQMEEEHKLQMSNVRLAHAAELKEREALKTELEKARRRTKELEQHTAYVESQWSKDREDLEAQRKERRRLESELGNVTQKWIALTQDIKASNNTKRLNVECPICLQRPQYDNYGSLDCGHAFCVSCIADLPEAKALLAVPGVPAAGEDALPDVEPQYAGYYEAVARPAAAAAAHAPSPAVLSRPKVSSVGKIRIPPGPIPCPSCREISRTVIHLFTSVSGICNEVSDSFFAPD